MKIKKGEYWRCTKVNSVARFTVGKVYKSECDSQLLDNNGETVEIVLSEFDRLYTIQDLKDGKVELHNTGTVEELNRVLNSAFPNCHESNGSYSYYDLSTGRDGWRGSPISLLPTQSVKDFLVQLPKEKEENLITPDSRELDNISPKHYAFNIKGTQCDVFDIANAMGLNIEQSTALRYFRKKENQIEDTKKAIKCLQRLVERLEIDRK